MVRVKVCGLTRLPDVLLAQERGADFLGFIFCESSPRHITPKLCQSIISYLDPATRTVGVFVNENPEKIIDIARSLRLSFIQLHGAESPADIVALNHAGLKTIKSIPVDTDGNYPETSGYPSDFLLFDSKIDDTFGGTGKRFTTGGLSDVKRPYFVAGGIDADNVADVCKTYTPYAVDVSSGLEKEPGIKSMKKIMQFFDVMDMINAG